MRVCFGVCLPVMKNSQKALPTRPFGQTGHSLPILGFGAMRMPVVAAPTGQPDAQPQLDETESVRLIRHAIDAGVTYVDTAYGYHGGRSEQAVGVALRDGYRERTFLATKFPCWEWKRAGDFDRILDEQLNRLQTDWIDGYLFHALNRDTWSRVCQQNGLLEKMIAAKQSGRVRSIGFSFHDSLDVFTSIIDATDAWDFCQIQFNYLDTDFQAGLAGLRYAHAKGLGVIVMEPLRGGKLADPPADVAACFAGTGRSAVEWALDFVWDHHEVCVLLSGMGTPHMVDENVRYAARSQARPLSTGGRAVINRARQAFLGDHAVPCTACSYCLPCPFGVAIPSVFQAYNDSLNDKAHPDGLKGGLAGAAGFEKAAGACTGCRSCEPKCPQHIVISERLKDVRDRFHRLSTPPEEDDHA